MGGGAHGGGGWLSEDMFNKAMARVNKDPVLSPQEQFYHAIRTNDEKALRILLADKTIDLNADKGEALRLAAENENYVFMRLLVLAGADLYHAKANTETMCSNAWQAYNSKVTKENKITYEHIQPIKSRLVNYFEGFATQILPIEKLRQEEKHLEVQLETLRQQGEILKTLAEVKNELFDMNKGKVIAKANFMRPAAAANEHAP